MLHGVRRRMPWRRMRQGSGVNLHRGRRDHPPPRKCPSRNVMPMPSQLPPIKRIRWTQAWRIVPSRYPPVGVFDRIADPDDLDALFALEAATNPRLRDELGALRMVPSARRVTGPGSTPVMAAFTHLDPAGSRFSDGSWGVFYAAHSVATAIEETVFHRQHFLAATAEPACGIQMRCYRTAVDARLHDIRGGWAP